MKKSIFLLLSLLFSFNLMAQNNLKTEFKSDAITLIEKQNNLLPFLNKYINSYFKERSSNEVFKLYRKQKTAEDEKKLLRVIEAQMTVLNGQEIKSIIVSHAEESEKFDFKLKLIIDLEVQTSDFKIPIKIVTLSGNDGNWFLQEKLNVKK